MRTLYHHGIVYTGALPLQQAFLVEDGRFAAVGSDEALEKLEADARVDLGGRFVCAGFNDSHMHLLGYGHYLSMAQLAGHTGSLRELLAYLRTYLAENPPREGQWLKGRGWNHDYFSDEKRMPDRRDLDAVSETIPIVITRACGHCAVVNSRALALAGIDEQTPAPEGGAIGRENGQPDGRLYDNAIDLVTAAIPLPDRAGLEQMILKACAALNAYGVTSVQTDDYSSFRGVAPEEINAAYRRLAQEGLLTVRVCEQCNFTTVDELDAFLAQGNTPGAGDAHFRIGPLKLLGDGSLGSRTAHLSRPYRGTNERGFSLLSDEQMRSLILQAHEAGMQVAVHAIGDACLDQVLDAVEAALQKKPRADHRHGVVHCQISRPDQLRRIRALGMQVYAQSIFLDYDNHIVEKLVDGELAASSYHWKTLLDSGVRVSNGSDAPVEPPDVLRGVRCAVTRRSLDGTGPYLPGEAFTVQEALDSFTLRGAEASFEETIKGAIRPGLLADFTVLGRDPFVEPPETLHTIPVLAAYLGGRRVFTREA